jgi:hypothetical protein
MESVSIKDLEVDIVNKKSYKAADMRFRLWWRKWLDERRTLSREAIAKMEAINNRLIKEMAELQRRGFALKRYFDEGIQTGHDELERYSIYGMICMDQDLWDKPLLHLLKYWTEPYSACTFEQDKVEFDTDKVSSYDKFQHSDWHEVLVKAAEAHHIELCRAFKHFFLGAYTFTLDDMMELDSEGFQFTIMMGV